jgi:lysophospholipase L1-like esterase
MTTRKQKILLVLVGLVITLLLIESALRLAGSIYTAFRTKNRQAIAPVGKQDIRILCLGDSFTFGLGGGYGDDYPSQLGQLLNENTQKNKFIVYNRGIPGNNSSMVLRNLVANINTYKPTVLFLLIGSNDSTTLEDSDCFLFKSLGIGKIALFSLKLDIFFSKLNTYRLIKISVLNLKSKFIRQEDYAEIEAREKLEYPKKRKNRNEHKDVNSNKETYLKKAEVLCLEKKFSDAENVLMQVPGGINPQNRRECLLLAEIYLNQGKHEAAINIIEGYIKENLLDEEIASKLGENYYFQSQKTTVMEKENLKQAAGLFKLALSMADSDDPTFKAENYGYLSRVYFALGNNVLAKEMIGHALEIQPKNKFFRQFKRIILGVSQAGKEKEIFERLLYYNLGQVINLCRIYNVEIILLNYPGEHSGSIRAEIASIYRVPFVDVGRAFNQALLKYSKEDIFSSDGAHPNPRGYKIMAESIFKELNSRKLGAF